MQEIETDKIRVQVQELTELPAASPLVTSLLEAVSNEDITIRELAALIRQEPSLVARIIGLANSAYFGHSEPITSVEDAIFKSLGLQLTKSLALSIALVGSFGGQPNVCFNLYDFWRQSVLSATLARMLSGDVLCAPRPSADDAYLAGMLHNFGMLPFAYLYPEALDDVCHLAHDEAEFARRMQTSLGIDQYEMGALLAHKWQIPEPVVEVIAHVNEPDYEGAYKPLVRLLHVVTRLVHQLPTEGELGDVDEAALTPFGQLGIGEVRVRSCLQGLQRKEAALEAMIHVLAS